MRRLCRALALVLVAASAAGGQTRTITETDLFSFVWVADPQISPDGSRVAFVRVTVDEKKDGYDTSLWLARVDVAGPPRRISGGLRDHSPRWSPDGTRLAFVRTAEKDGKPQPPQVFVMSLGESSGGEARAVTNIPRGAGGPVWSPDGKTIAFTSSAKPEEVKPEEIKTEDEKEDPPRVSDVRVITEARYRANGVADFGFVDADRPSHIWLTAVSAGVFEPAPPTQITSGEFGAGNVQWSRDGARLFFTSDRREGSEHLPFDSDLYAVAREGGEAQPVASIDGGIGPYALSPDGRRVAFIGTLAGDPVRSYSQSDLWVANLSGGAPTNLTGGYDFDIGGGLGGDQRAPRGGSPAPVVWTADGRALIVRVGEQGDANLKRIDAASGAVDAVTSGHHDVMSYTASADGRRFALVRSTATVVGDLQALDASPGSAGTLTKLSGFNDALFGGITQSEPEEIWYDSFDGKKIQGWVLKPPSFDASRKYPLIVQIHGGPHSAYGSTYTHEFQWMAAKGYVVLYTNPRGSSNYGQDFGNIIQYRYPGDDANDIMAGVDWLLTQGYVDEARMGVTGGSGGGLLTNWVVTQTTRFKAAVSQRDISDWASFWYTADFTLFTPTWFRKAPFEDPKEFADRSPITFVEKIETPILFILGDEDWRTPPSAGGEPLFRALRYLKKEAVMVRFPDENHELSRSGKPWHRIERLQHIVGWMDRWLK